MSEVPCTSPRNSRASQENLRRKGNFGGDVVYYLQGDYLPLFLRSDGDTFVFLGLCILYEHNHTSVQAEMSNQGLYQSFDII